MQHKRQEHNTRATQMRHKRHECYTKDASATRVKDLNFDNDASENTFSYPYIVYMANERLEEVEQIHSKNYLLEMPRSHAKMSLKSAPQKLNFVMAKDISKIIH